jgi:antitoxin PrlF
MALVRARVTSKGQVTIPVELRRRLSIESGDDLVFADTPDGALVRVVHRKKLSEYRGALALEGKALDHREERRRAAQALATSDS